VCTVEPGNSQSATESRRSGNLRPQVRAPARRQRDDRLGVCVVQILPPRRGPTSRRPALPGRHPGDGAPLADTPDAAPMEGREFLAGPRPRPTHGLPGSGARPRRDAAADRRLLPPVDVRLQRVSGPRPVRRAQ